MLERERVTNLLLIVAAVWRNIALIRMACAIALAAIRTNAPTVIKARILPDARIIGDSHTTYGTCLVPIAGTI